MEGWWRRWMPGSWASGAANVLAMACGALLVGQWLAARPLWLDEQMIALNLRDRTAANLFGPLWLDQAAPLGWLLLQRAVLSLLGTGELALRLFPVLFGLGVIVVSLWVGRRWLGPVGAVYLTLLAGVSQWIAYYATELKPYSGDVFWAFLLPSLAVWVIEAPDPFKRRRRVLCWWVVAAMSQWLAFGALFVAPCAAVLFVAGVRGLDRAAHVERVRLLTGGLIWLVAVGLHYALSIRHASGNASLARYWASALAPSDVGGVDTVMWLFNRLAALALKPGGTSLVLVFWVVAIMGWVVARRPFGALMASIPVMAVVLALLGLVPLFERLALWTVPAMLVGIAMAADWAARSFSRGHTGARFRRHVVPSIILVGATALVADMVPRGLRELNRGGDTNHALDDRSGVSWILARYRPGDVIVTTQLSLPALWWYGTVADSNAIITARFVPDLTQCAKPPLTHLSPDRRILVYLGFRFDDVPPGFDQLLFNTLGRVAGLAELQEWPGVGRAAVLTPGPMVMPELSPRFDDEPHTPSGCIEFVPAQRW